VISESGSVGRNDIEFIWKALIEGRLTREEVHAWAFPMWTNEDFADGFVLSALQQLDGFDLTESPDKKGFVRHGPPGDYIRSMDDVSRQFNEWLQRCAEFEADPETYRRRKQEREAPLLDAERQIIAERKEHRREDQPT
jgi:hypothetical protein